jgi:hypothetical protein
LRQDAGLHLLIPYFTLFISDKVREHSDAGMARAHRVVTYDLGGRMIRTADDSNSVPCSLGVDHMRLRGVSPQVTHSLRNLDLLRSLMRTVSRCPPLLACPVTPGSQWQARGKMPVLTGRGEFQVNSLLCNPHICIEPYVHQLIPAILTCVVGKRLVRTALVPEHVRYMELESRHEDQESTAVAL